MSTETVQSFLQEEVLDLVLEPEALDQWHLMVKEMGLTGQSEVAKPNKSPIPFLYMTPSMVATFDTLCPREVELKDYKAGAIPLKALEHIKLAQTEGHFHRIMIRYDDKSPDPVAIGEEGKFYPQGTHGKYLAYGSRLNSEEKEIALVEYPTMTFGFIVENRFLIARWGAEIERLEILAKKAKERYMREKMADLSKKVKEAQNSISTMEEEATILFCC